MNRTEVIQKILNAKSNPTYLEIGVKRGENFFPIKAGRKIAVDPQFQFSTKDKIKWAYKNPSNLRASYHEVTSDTYFKNLGKSYKLDLVFIDGLHTYQQSLMDAINSLDSLNEDGVIIMHDCNPPHKAAAYPAESKEYATSLNLSGWTGEWCGDVWKTICNLRSTRNDLNAFVLNCDYGLGIITKGQAESVLNMPVGALDAMTYDELSQNKVGILNIKEESFLSDFLESL